MSAGIDIATNVAWIITNVLLHGDATSQVAGMGDVKLAEAKQEQAAIAAQAALATRMAPVTSALQTTVSASELGSISLYIPDQDPWMDDQWGWQVPVGFDCDDYATAMINYFTNTAASTPALQSGTYSYIYAGYPASAHALVLATFGEVHYVINPPTAYISPPLSSAAEIKPAVATALINGGYSYQAGQALDVQIYPLPPTGTAPFGEDTPPFYTSPAIVGSLAADLLSQGVTDVTLYLPIPPMPPTAPEMPEPPDPNDP